MVRTGDWLSEGWEVVMRDIWTHILIALVVGLGTVFTLGILYGPLMCGWYHILLMQLRDPSYRPDVNDLGEGFQVFGQAFLAWLVLLVAGLVLGGVSATSSMIVGSIPVLGQLVAPFVGLALGIAFQTIFLFVFVLIVEKRRDFWPAIEQSVGTVAGNFWGFLGFAALLYLVNLAGLCACLVGVLVAAPVVAAATVCAYRDNFDVEGPAAAPPTEQAPPPSPTGLPPPPRPTE